MSLKYYKGGDWNTVTPWYRSPAVISGETEWKGIPGATFQEGNSGAFGIVSSRVSYAVWVVDRPVTLNALEMVCVTASDVASMAAVLYRADYRFFPVGSHIATSGSLDCTTTGVKTGVLASPVLLQPGRYVLLQGRDPVTGTNPAFRTFECGMPASFVTSTGNVLSTLNRYRSDSTLAAALHTSPPVDPDPPNVRETFSTNGMTQFTLGVFDL